MGSRFDNRGNLPFQIAFGKVGAEKKELTPQEIQKRKKMLVYPLFFLVFAGAIWLIFAPSGKQGAEQVDGFNPNIPLPVENGIISNKRDAYEQEVQKNKEQDKMRSLQDFSSMFEGTEQVEMEKQPEQIKPAPIESLASAYRDVNNQLGHWYDEPITEVDEQSKLALEFRIQELERKQEEENEKKNSMDEQLAMVEKSYQIAAKEMAANMGSSVGTSISISDNAGSQLAADFGKGVIQGASQYLNRKFRTVKVTLKANYRVLLLPPLQ
jgi:hypothetical protein